MASHWIPEDDFRLRKSIENGASLESLAKGAVKFSQRFTLSELTDRWYSLLYNPQVRSLSSSIGFDLEHSDQFLPQSHHHHHHTTPVRSQYYTARKRMRLEEPLNVAFGGNVFGGSDFLDLQFDDSEIEILNNSFREIIFPLDEDCDDDRMANQLLNINDGQIQEFNVTDTTTTTLEQFFHQEEFQDSLFQQPNTSFSETTSQSHQQVVHDQAETWNAPESYQDLPNKPEEYCHEAMLDQAETWNAPESYQDLPNKPEEYCHEAMPLSKLDPHPEIKNGLYICTLSEAFGEIPNNDDINLQLYKPKARNSINPSSLPSLRKHMKPPLPPTRGSSLSQVKGNDFINSYGIGDCAVTEQASCSSAFKNSYTEKATSSFTATISTSQQHSPDKDICEQTLSAEMDIDASMSEEEENHNEIESDEDLPSFSDVEAMVLDMDLEPIGQDRYELEATRYRNEEMARMLMRLEQSSKSYMNRIIASHGAFAILYGSSKHYITKPEVLLGRATGEYPVDIDLGRLGSGTKVSRRQALIRLKQDGCFEIKNLGKFSIWINEKEIEHREIVNLKNSSLIQIREMSFVFETNEKAVKRYLDGIHI